MKKLAFFIPLLLLATLTFAINETKPKANREGPLRILFLGHDREHHNSNAYFPMLAKALGREAIYFDYHTTVEEALGDYAYLSRFDGVLLYANHDQVTPKQFSNLVRFVEEGGGFIPVHSASACFQNEPAFTKLVGGKFARHKGEEFTAAIIDPNHPAMQEVSEFQAWDETYVHADHGDDRTILMVRQPQEDDNITEPEPWTWTRNQGLGRVFYTASGHDQRVWKRAEFHQLLKAGILWAVGDTRRESYQRFLSTRTPMQYEKRDNIPNYEERPEPLPYQLPLSPADSLSYTQVPVGWNLELFAAEPDIINPIYMQWDERGRLWVLETIDYPNEVRSEEPGDDSLKILEDTDGDGRCDKVTVFASELNIPTSFTFGKGGVFLHQAPNTFFLQDTNGDDVADIKEVVFSGWGTNDTHAGPSNLRYGLDNQIWGTVGYAAYQGKIAGQDTDFRMGTYRFPKDGSQLEFLHQFNNNTWGLGFNAQGDVFGSTANRHPSFFCGIPASAYPTGKGLTAKSVASSPDFQPITPNIRQVDAFGQFTAGAGHVLANSNSFPESWRGRMAFVNGPTGNLVGKLMTVRDGAGYTTKNLHSIIASTDEYFSPVVAEVGPDGHLWIADWYNFIIQHNPTPNPARGGYEGARGKGNAHINPNRDRKHGRIYRLVWEGAEKSQTNSLDNADTPQLLAALSDSNQFWRLTAQRLLVDGSKKDAQAALVALLKEPGAAAIHALWSLHGLGLLDNEGYRQALLAQDPALRRNAVRALTLDTNGANLLFESGLINDPDLVTRLAAFVTLSLIPTTDAVKSAVAGLMGDPANQQDEWLTAALQAAAASHEVEATGIGAKSGPNLLLDAKWAKHIYSGEGSLRVLPKGGPEGARAFNVRSGTGADAAFRTDVEVKPETNYRLSGFIRTQGAHGATGALLNIHQLQKPKRVATRALNGSARWTEVSVDFNSSNHKLLTVNALFGGWGQATGQGSFSKIELYELSPAENDATAQTLKAPDAARGQEIFHNHQAAACSRCHQLNGEGGVIGPALDHIASRKDADYIREALLQPNATIAEGFPSQVSPMPPMDLLLNPQEIEDILLYLQTLK